MTNQNLFEGAPTGAPVLDRRTNLPAPWRRVDGGAGKCSARYVGPQGYEIHHCGHPTANWPYALWSPAGELLLAPNGRAWRDLKAAAAEVARLIGGQV